MSVIHSEVEEKGEQRKNIQFRTTGAQNRLYRKAYIWPMAIWLFAFSYVCVHMTRRKTEGDRDLGVLPLPLMY